MRSLIGFIFLCLVSLPTHSDALRLDNNQVNLMKQVHNIWGQLGFPETGQAILLQETAAGKFGDGVGDRHQPVGKRSYGAMQVKVSTTRFVFAQFPELKEEYFIKKNMANVSDEEIIVKLITDDEFNILIASKNFYLMMMYSKNNWHRAVASYNTGYGTAKTFNNPEKFEYVQSIMKHINTTVKPFNKKYSL